MRLVDAQYSEVYLAGELGKRFGRMRRLVCKTPAQALRLIGLERPDFKAHMMKLAKDGVNFHVIADRRSLTEQQLPLPIKQRLIISMEVSGAKGLMGGLEIVAGVALIALAWWNPAGWVGSGALFSAAGQAAAYGVGASLIFGGITALLTSLQKGSSSSLQSYAFNGPVNTQQQGAPVPIVYGRMMVGGQAISASLEAVDSSAAGVESGLIQE